MGGWGVAFHNTDMALTNPNSAIKNCFGDIFTHGLCPSNPLARNYAIELFSGISASGYFDRVLAESISYLLYPHGHPHELWGARMDVTTKYLISLCFCYFCMSSGVSMGVDCERLRKRVANELGRTWNASYPSGRQPDEGTELASLLINWPELATYTQMRLQSVSSLVRLVSDACHKDGVKFDLSAAVWGRPSSLNWLEGVDISKSIASSDRFLLESYYESSLDVAREIDHTLALQNVIEEPKGEIAVALTLWQSHHRNFNGFAEKIDTIKSAGIHTLVLYNYGTATAETLQWVKKAAKMITEI
jgi:hypothetical protein